MRSSRFVVSALKMDHRVKYWYKRKPGKLLLPKHEPTFSNKQIIRIELMESGDCGG